MVQFVSPGRGLPRRDRGVDRGQGGIHLLVLRLHAQHDLRFQIDPGQQRWPQQLVLALVVVLQPQPVVAEVVGDHLGAHRISRGDRRDQFHQQP